MYVCMTFLVLMLLSNELKFLRSTFRC